MNFAIYIGDAQHFPEAINSFTLPQADSSDLAAILTRDIPESPLERSMLLISADLPELVMRSLRRETAGKVA